jgi:hypothetical protein
VVLPDDSGPKISTTRPRAAHAEREVDADGAGGDGVDRLNRALLAEAHDRPLPELLFNLDDGQVDRLDAFPFLPFVSFNRHRW